MSENETERNEAVAEGPGRRLAAAREARGLSVDDVAMRMKFAPRQIEALEADEYDQLPGIAIVRGMVRAYARIVELDGDPLIAALDQRVKAGPMTVHPVDMHVPIKESRKESRAFLVMSLVVLIAMGAFALEWYVRDRRTTEQAAVPPAATSKPQIKQDIKPAAQPSLVEEAAPAPAAVVHPVAMQSMTVPAVPPKRETPPPAVAEPVAPAPVEAVEAPAPEPTVVAVAPQSDKALQMRFTDEVWVEVKDAHGRVLVSRLAAAGSALALDGAAPLSVVLGNADGVEVSYEGQAIDLAPYSRTGVARLKLE